MKKIALSMLFASVIVGVSFASSYISFINPGDAKVFDENGTPVRSEDLYEGYILATGETPITLEKNNDTVVVDKSSIISASTINDSELELYLFNGKTDVVHNNSNDIVISTPWSKYIAKDSATFYVRSDEREENVNSRNGDIYAVNNLSNEINIIKSGEYYNALSNEEITLSPTGAFSLTPEMAYERGKLKMPTAPSTAPGFTNAYTFDTPINSTEYNKADDWALIREDYTEFIKSSITEERVTTSTARPIIINSGVAVEDFKTGWLPALDQYIANQVDGGVKLQMYSNTDSVGHYKSASESGWMTEPGELYTNSLSIAALPYIKFASSTIELRLNIGINPATGELMYPWQTPFQNNAANGIGWVTQFINDINIENVLFISRSRDLPLKLSPLNLLPHLSDGIKIPLLLDADLKYIRLNAYAEDLENINGKDVMRSATLSILPIRGIYDLSLNLGVIYHRTDSTTKDNAQMLFNVSLDMPIIKNNVLSIGVHGGLPWSWQEELIGDLFKDPSNATFYTGLYLTSEFGPFKGILGLDYSQNRIFTGYLNKFSSWSILNLLDGGITGLKTLVPYLNASADFGYAGIGLMINGAIFVGNTRPTMANYNNEALYLMNSKISAFVRPFGTDALKITIEYDLQNIFEDAFSSPSGTLKPYNSIKQNWIPNFIISSLTGPVFIKGTLDFDNDENNTYQPKIGLLMSIDLGSNYVFNPSYYRARNSKNTKRANEWSPILNLEITDAVHFFSLRDTDTGKNIVSLFNAFNFKPIVGVEHPIFALKVQLEVSDISFSDFNNAANWRVGEWIDRLVNQLRFEKIFNFEANSSYDIKKNSVISYTPVREKLQLDLNLFNIFGINIRNFTNWLDTILLKRELAPTDIFIGYKSDTLNAYVAATATGEWPSDATQNPLNLLFYPTLNFDINIKGAKIGLFFGTTINLVQSRASGNELQFILGMSGRFNAWNMLAGATIGYENPSFLFEVTGGVQQNNATYKRFDALTINSNDEGIDGSTSYISTADMAYTVLDKDGNQIRGALVPFFDVTIGGKIDGVFSLKLSYNINLSSTFKTLYYDRLSASINITTDVVDIFGVLEKRGAFFGDSLTNLWTSPMDVKTAFAYRGGATVKADFATFTVEYANEFFGGRINLRKAGGEPLAIGNTGTLSFKAVLGLI